MILGVLHCHPYQTGCYKCTTIYHFISLRYKTLHKIIRFNDPKISTILHLSRVHGPHKFRIYPSINDISCHSQVEAERSILLVSLRV